MRVPHGRIVFMPIPPPSVSERWVGIRAELASRYPALIPFYNAASRHAKIMALFPFLSMGRLCFSRCTRFPYFVDFLVCATRDGYFSLEQSNGTGDWVYTSNHGEGDANAVAEYLDATIPDDYGAAIEGSADALSLT